MFRLLVVLCILPNIFFFKIGNAQVNDSTKNKDSININNLMENFVNDVLTRKYFTKQLQKKYITKNYVYLGSELPNSTFHVIDDFKIDSIEVDCEDAKVWIKFQKKAYFSFREFVITNEKFTLSFALKKINDNQWKIDDFLSYYTMALFDSDNIYYVLNLLEHIIKIMEPYEENNRTNANDYKRLKNMYQNVLYYYHNDFQYSREYLNKQSIEELRIKRNEIFAHYGRIFKTESLQEYFNNKSWYNPNPEYSVDLLTDNDLENIKLIKQVEEEKKETEIGDQDR